MSKCCLVLQVLALTTAAIAVDPPAQINKPNLTVYYESLCPDCISFITNQFTPTFRQLYANHSIAIELVPFGNAETLDNGTTWRCQHGERECYGNKIQACALNDIQLKNPSHFLEAQVSFVDCVMRNSLGQQPVYPTRMCTAKLNADEYEACANGEAGNKLLAKMMYTTKRLVPALRWVPTIVFNNEFSEDDNNKAQNNFKEVLCKYLNEPKPAACPIASPKVIAGVQSNTTSANAI